MSWISRVATLFQRKKLEKRLDEELAFHLSMREQWNVEQGMIFHTIHNRSNQLAGVCRDHTLARALRRPQPTRGQWCIGIHVDS